MSESPAPPDKETLQSRLARLFPDLTAAELEEAEENLRRYAALTARMHQRLRHEKQAPLTDSDS